MTTKTILSIPETETDYAMEVRICGDYAQVWVNGKFDGDSPSATGLSDRYGFSEAQTEQIHTALCSARPKLMPRNVEVDGLYDDPLSHNPTARLIDETSSEAQGRRH